MFDETCLDHAQAKAIQLVRAIRELVAEDRREASPAGDFVLRDIEERFRGIDERLGELERALACRKDSTGSPHRRLWQRLLPFGNGDQ